VNADGCAEPASDEPAVPAARLSVDGRRGSGRRALRDLLPQFGHLAWSRIVARALPWTLLLALAGTAFISPPAAGAAPPLTKSPRVNPPTADELFRKWGAVYGVEWQLLKSIAVTESRLDANAVNAADNESIGLMQILCRPDGQGGCSNRLNVDGWSEATREKLFDADFNIRIGAQILAWNIRTYGMPRAIGVYNRWAERTAPVAGPFENQAYVDAVLAHYQGTCGPFCGPPNRPASLRRSLLPPGIDSPS
jgi:soluble lytic murein transglycosylase-like protein